MKSKYLEAAGLRRLPAEAARLLLLAAQDGVENGDLSLGDAFL